MRFKKIKRSCNSLKISEGYFWKNLDPEDSSARRIGNLKDRHEAEVPLSLRSFWGFADERPWRHEPWRVSVWSKLGQRSERSDKCTEIFFFFFFFWSKFPRATNGCSETFGFQHYIQQRWNPVLHGCIRKWTVIHKYRNVMSIFPFPHVHEKQRLTLINSLRGPI